MRSSRTALIALLVVAILAAPLAAKAQAAGTVYRIGHLTTPPSSDPGAACVLDGFFEGMRYWLEQAEAEMRELGTS